MKKCAALRDVPLQLDEQSINELITSVHMLHVCAGHPDNNFLSFVESKKGKLCNKSGGVAVFADHYGLSRVIYRSYIMRRLVVQP